MVSNPPKVSFIPKGPLAREESFMMRRRPRSITGFLAIFAFIVSVGSYGGFYFYEKTLLAEVEKKAKDIADAQRVFIQSPEINQAKVFRARADLARALLDQHTVVSPIFTFLSNSTLGSILYDSFSFKRESNGWSLTLTGEAPSYASLAYQSDVLNKKNKDNEFVDFSISNIALTKSGTVTFGLVVTFAQQQLLYTKEGIIPQPTIESTPVGDISAPTVSSEPIVPSFETQTTPTAPVTPAGTSDASSIATTTAMTTETSASFGTTSAASGWTVEPVVGSPVAETTKTPTVTTAPAATPTSWWSWFKFW
ncbi:MAG: hypothetical protein A2937_01645 [Candidatus Yonathbacteria bacterium RIFCSPLOWO2_01_FULL_47_33b]|uniref:Uncharacterized protein n=1 Tax=Candidatus Yonathbacteria bacterium RIFCSPLOWO2_01_FULL_47_33b TaxID=1802727 RepID=A0A1G2SIE2_9BACT|nr:MAG: hypothetical protein A2937_01645 [Candidatus Yonathbacteria bacterium RIFCSPLOWO2_01_FULL_47_33b]